MRSQTRRGCDNKPVDVDTIPLNNSEWTAPPLNNSEWIQCMVHVDRDVHGLPGTPCSLCTGDRLWAHTARRCLEWHPHPARVRSTACSRTHHRQGSGARCQAAGAHKRWGGARGVMGTRHNWRCNDGHRATEHSRIETPADLGAHVPWCMGPGGPSPHNSSSGPPAQCPHGRKGDRQRPHQAASSTHG